MGKGRAYESFEIFTSALRMDAKMHSYIILGLIVVHMLAFGGLIAATWNHKKLNALSFCVARIAVALKQDQAQFNVFNADGSVHKKPVRSIISTTRDNAKKQGWLLVLFFVVTSPVYLFHRVIIKRLSREAQEREDKQYVRGSKLITTDDFWRQIKEEDVQTGFPLGQIAMPVMNETRGTVLIGGPGTGKTQALRHVLKKIKERRGHGIIYDYKGDYISEFYDPDTDLIFNAVDERCLGWRLFNDIESKTDIEAVVHSLVPNPAHGNPFWEEGVRSIFAAGLRYNYKHHFLTNEHIWDFVSTPTAQMKDKLSGVKGAEAALKALGDSENSRQADGFQAVLMQYCKCFEYMAKIDGAFSISDWVANGSGLIFVTNYESITHTLRPIMSLFIDMVICKLLSLPDSSTRRFYTVLDEFGTLNKLNIPRLSTTGRSKGSILIMATQDRKQPIKIYGRETVDSMDDALKNRVIFALEGDAAEYESKVRIKETEYIKHERSVSMGPDDHRDGVSLNPRKYKEPLFLPADIARLKDLQAIVSLQNYDFLLSRWEYDEPQPVHDQLILRKDLSLSYLEAEEQRQKQEASNIPKNFEGNFDEDED